MIDLNTKKPNKIKKFATAAILAVAAWAVLSVSAHICTAQPRTFETTQTCQVGDSQSRNEARTLCFLEAKRTLAEQAGSYIQVVTRTKDFQLTSDEITSYSAALIQSEIVNEQLLVTNGTLALTMTVRAQVDPDILLERLDRIDADAKSRAMVDQRMDTQSQLEENLKSDETDELSSLKTVAPGEWTPEGRRPPPPPRSAPRRPAPPKSPEQIQAEQRELLDALSRQTRTAKATVRPGMTRDEVEDMLGAPRAGKRTSAFGSNWTCQMHGRVWVVYKDGVVRCTRRKLSYSRDYNSDCHCTGMAQDFIAR